MRRQDEQAFEERCNEADDDTFGHHRNEFTCSSSDEQQRSEGRDRRRDSDCDRPQDFVRPGDDRAAQLHAFFDLPVDILEYDDCIVDEHARYEQHPDQGVRIDADIEQGEEDDRREEAERDCDDREHRVAKADREPEQRCNEDHPGGQVVEQDADSGGHEVRVIQCRVDLNAFRHERGELFEEGVDRRDEVPDIRLVLLADGDEGGGLSVVAGDEDGFFQAALDPADVADTNARARSVLEDDGVEDFLDRGIVAGRTQCGLAEFVLEGAGGQVLVLAPHAIGDVLYR